MISIEEAKQDLLKAATRLALKIQSSDGQADAIRHLVPLYLEKNQVDFAISLANCISDPFTRDQVLAQIAEKCASIGNDDYAFQLVEVVEDDSLYLQALERIATQKIAINELEKAVSIAEKLENPDNVYLELALHLAEKDKLQQARHQIENIFFPTTKAFALQQIGVNLLNLKRNEEALRFIEEAFEATSEIDYKIDEIKLLIEIASAFKKAGIPDKAIFALKRSKQKATLLSEPDRSHFLSAVSVALLENDKLELADETLDLISDKTIIAATLIGFASVFWNKNEKVEALDALEEAYQLLKIQKESEIRSTTFRLQLFRKIAVQLANFEQMEKALAVAEMIENEQELQMTLSQIAQVLAAHGKDKSAHEIAQKIKESDAQTFALISLADVKFSLGRKDEAIGYLDLASENITSIEQPFSLSQACNEIAKRYIECGKKTSIAKLRSRSLEAISMIRDETLKVICLAQLAQVYERSLREHEKNLENYLEVSVVPTSQETSPEYSSKKSSVLGSSEVKSLSEGHFSSIETLESENALTRSSTQTHITTLSDAEQALLREILLKAEIGS